MKKGPPPFKPRSADSLEEGSQADPDDPDDYIGILDPGCDALEVDACCKAYR